MSFGITLDVADDGTVDVVSVTRGESAKPPAGRYVLAGHRHSGDDAASSISVRTPLGGISAYVAE